MGAGNPLRGPAPARTRTLRGDGDRAGVTLRYTAPMSREPTPGLTADAAHGYTPRAVRSLYPRIRTDHLRYLERWGLLRRSGHPAGEAGYGFADMAVIRQVDADLARGVSFRAALRGLLAAREGQLSLDFRTARGESQPARVLTLGDRLRPSEGGSPAATAGVAPDRTPAERQFLEASRIDAGGAGSPEAAMDAYRAALDLDPDLVPALINLGNLHYLQGRPAEAQALYLQASLVDASSFEAWFNLGNVHHDRGRLEDAAQCYAEALRWRPTYADAHFYLAVTLEKLGRGDQARPHWRAYQDLAPDGEWIDLAREFGAE